MEDKRSDIRTKGRVHSDSVVKYILTGVAMISVAVTLFIIFFLVMKSADALGNPGLVKIFTGTRWEPSSELFGVVPLVVGTLFITLGAMLF
ncbi:MAG: hypothetical protein FWG19_02840, partial [Methanomassiliicoccaceae archaeon]|nr:hypothetical protein [Methanomassiliicoccaceae archaeon]